LRVAVVQVVKAMDAAAVPEAEHEQEGTFDQAHDPAAKADA